MNSLVCFSVFVLLNLLSISALSLPKFPVNFSFLNGLKKDDPCTYNEKNAERYQLATRNMAFPRQVPKSYVEYCADAKSNFEKFEQAAKCEKGQRQQLLNLFVEGVRLSLAKRCAPNATSTDALKCDKIAEAFDDVNKCVDREVNSLLYIAKSIPPNRQLNSICCIKSPLKQCVTRKAAKECNSNFADFIRKSITEPFSVFEDTICDKAYCAKYGEEQNELDNIFEKSQIGERIQKGELNLFRALFTIFDNHLLALNIPDTVYKTTP